VTAPEAAGTAPFHHEGGPTGVLVLHGFTGSPDALRGVATALAAAGHTVELPLLPGHGTDLSDMVTTGWSDWSGAAEAAYRALAETCPRVAVTGLSMGGTLACWLAERHPEIAGIALVNPGVEPPEDSFRAVIRDMLDSGTRIAPGIGSDIAKPGVVELSYDGTPLAPALSFFDGVDEVAGALGEIRCPVLLLSSREDHVLPTSNGDFLVAGVSGPVQRVWLERSYHVATLDHDAEEVEARITEFFTQVLSPLPSEPNRGTVRV
jgi:carboxylesterase